MAKDITKTGALSYRELQKENSLDGNVLTREAFENIGINEGLIGSNQGARYVLARNAQVSDRPVQSPLYQASKGADYYGKSMFDEDITIGEGDWEHLSDRRAFSQPWYAQLGAGIGKGVALAATTFLDGTIGLLGGLVELPEKGISALWDNEISNTLADANRALEEILPNYRTESEQENAWYQNLGTMNFWADGVIKNLGFTVGAFYSGNAWTKALQGIGLIKKGAMGAKAVGSMLSAVNEGRIEANNTVYDINQLYDAQIEDARTKRRKEITNSNLSFEDKQLALRELDENLINLRNEAQDRANAVGLATLIGNTILLSLDNFSEFGKLYARGFKNAKGLSSNIVKAAEEEAIEQAGRNVIRQGNKYTWKDITKSEALMKGIKNGLLEGNEEMSQAFIASTAGYMQEYDSPDSYYKALIDPQAQRKTKDFITSVTQGFKDTYGNGDRWEEFAVGMFTGLLGMPTFGKVNNSDANTYLGRGKNIGLSGGLFGEIGYANQQNREGREAINVMNKYMDKLQNHANYFIQSQSFTDAMNGWSEADNAFEYKNAEDNDDFVAISRFAQTGKLNDLKELVRQDFEHLDENALTDIALHTTPNIQLGAGGGVITVNNDNSPQQGGWRNIDGSLMSDTEEGRNKMKQELIKKRDKILSEIDKYENSVEAVRAIGNNSLTEDQVNELAWLNWKVGMFTDRYNSIKEENQEFIRRLRNTIGAFQNGRGRGMIDEESEEGKNILKGIDTMGEFLDYLDNSDTPLQLSRILKANPKLLESLEEFIYPILEDLTGIDNATFNKSMKDLKDAVKIASATETFNERYKDFIENPIKLIKNREKINSKKDKVNTASEKVGLKDKVNNASVSDIVNGIDEGKLDTSELDGLFTDEDNAFLQGMTEGTTGQQKIDEAKGIINTANQMNHAINELFSDSSIDAQALADAKTMLDQSKKVSNSEQELMDVARQVYNDPTLLYDDTDPSLMGLTQEELESVLDDRVQEAKSVIQRVIGKVQDAQKELQDLPNDLEKIASFNVDGAKNTKEVGHDPVNKTPTENERKQAQQLKEQQQQVEQENKNKIIDFFKEDSEDLSDEDKATFNKTLQDVINDINMMVEVDASDKEMNNAIKDSESYNTLKRLSPNIDSKLDIYVTNRRKERGKTVTNVTSNQTSSQEDKLPTPVVTADEVVTYTNQTESQDPNKGELTGVYQYWKPTITYLPIHNKKGNFTPFYKLARTMTYPNGNPMFNAQQINRIEKVGKYLDEHGAFALVDRGEVKVGDVIHFSIDKSLSDDVGELVILMTDNQGRVIGDVMSPNDPTFSRQVGLPALVQKIQEEYEKAGSPEHFTSSLTTKVDKNMVGKVLFNDTFNTLNALHTNGSEQIPFTLGIAATNGSNARILATAGRTKKQGASQLERTILPPINAKAGQPFLLVPTSSSKNHFIPIPFIMESYSPTTSNTALGRAIRSILERIPSSDNKNAMSIVSGLEELLSLKEVHVNYDGDNVKVTIKPYGAEHQRVIYNGSKNNPTTVDQIEYGLQVQSIPFQISRKYINDTYNGQDYNRMIGEIAKANIPIGYTHTISDWFTLKPLDVNGEMMKAKSPRSTGMNPNAAKVPQITITRGNMQLYVDTKTWEVTDGKKVYSGEKTNKVKARAFGIYTNQNMEKPYNTEWGYYDPKTDNFVEKPIKVLRTLGTPSTSPKQLTLTNPYTETTYVVKVGETRRIDDGMYPGVSTITDIKADGTIVDSYYDETSGETTTREFSSEGYLTELSYSTLVTSQDTPQTDTPAQLEEKAKRVGLLGNKVRQALWQVLTPSQQSIIANKKGPKQKQWMDALENAFNVSTNTFDEKKLKGSVDDLLGRKALYRMATGSNKVWDEKKELGWMKRVLPNLSDDEHLKIVQGVSKLATDDGYAYGKFQDGVITLAGQTSRGTLYHEAFHAVAHTLLNSNEITALMEAAKDKWGDIGDIALEENLAEDFRRYAQWEETPVLGTMIKVYRALKHFIQNLVGNETYINKLYYDISRGNLSNRTPNTDSQSYYRRVEQYYRDKMLYNNLPQEDINYLQERGISIEEYNNMTQLEKEVLFNCKY